MKIPYRTKRALKRLVLMLLAVLLAGAVVWLCYFFWLGRYVVYTRDGARIDFDKNAQTIEGTPAMEHTVRETVKIYIQQTEPEEAQQEKLSQILGYYISEEDLTRNMDGVRAAVAQLEPGTAVMLQMKTSYGNFNYDSQVSGVRNGDMDIEAMGMLVNEMNEAGLYTVARIPAFRDYYYGLNHVPDGLPTSGGYLWADADYCYWLNPASEGTVAYLMSIVSELKGMGFDEVVFSEFHFPETDNIVFSGDRNEALAAAATALVNGCATEDFTVSFIGGTDFALPARRSRLYLSEVAAADLQTVIAQTGVAEPQTQLVFLTDLHDTRFDEYSVLRPLQVAG